MTAVGTLEFKVQSENCVTPDFSTRLLFEVAVRVVSGERKIRIVLSLPMTDCPSTKDTSVCQYGERDCIVAAAAEIGDDLAADAEGQIEAAI
jgi:hypothetical protein